MTTALITHADCLLHETPEGHPERVARLEHVLHALESLELKRVTAPLAAEDDILRVHPADYLADIRRQAPLRGAVALDADTWMSSGSLDAAFRSAGAAVRAVDLVLAGEVRNAFAAIRPPGHHAESSTPMGFCIFGNASIAAKHALDHHGLARVAVVDFDVHHGNGTQALLWEEARALLVTSQQMPLWPGSGQPEEDGAYENILNIPLAPGSTGRDMRTAYEQLAFPRLAAFRPELIIVSAGFDAHENDPLAELNWRTEDYRWLSRAICEIAAEHCEGRIVSLLEGGYDLAALADASKAHVQELMKASA